MDKNEVLRRTPIFANLSEDELGELAGLAAEAGFEPGEYIFWEGEQSRQFYLVLEGRVKVFKLSSGGKEFIIAFFEAGEMFGEAAVFQGKPYPASAQATLKTRVLVFSKDAFISFLSRHQGVALNIIGMLSERLRNAQSRLKDLAGERAEQRLARILVMLSSKLGLVLPFTRQEIADMAGVTTETAIRVMSQLKERGIIRSMRGKITIADEGKLRLLAEGPPQI